MWFLRTWHPDLIPFTPTESRQTPPMFTKPNQVQEDLETLEVNKKLPECLFFLFVDGKETKSISNLDHKQLFFLFSVLYV